MKSISSGRVLCRWPYQENAVGSFEIENCIGSRGAGWGGGVEGCMVGGMHREGGGGGGSVGGGTVGVCLCLLPVIPAPLPRDRGLRGSAAKKRPGEQQPSRLPRRVLGRRAGLQLPPRPHRRDHERTAGCQLGARCGANAVHEAPRRKRARARRTGHQGAA